jgi:hypothetical protein
MRFGAGLDDSKPGELDHHQRLSDVGPLPAFAGSGLAPTATAWLPVSGGSGSVGGPASLHQQHEYQYQHFQQQQQSNMQQRPSAGAHDSWNKFVSTSPNNFDPHRRALDSSIDDEPISEFRRRMSQGALWQQATDLNPSGACLSRALESQPNPQQWPESHSSPRNEFLRSLADFGYSNPAADFSAAVHGPGGPALTAHPASRAMDFESSMSGVSGYGVLLDSSSLTVHPQHFANFLSMSSSSSPGQYPPGLLQLQFFNSYNDDTMSSSQDSVATVTDQLPVPPVTMGGHEVRFSHPVNPFHGNPHAGSFDASSGSMLSSGSTQHSDLHRGGGVMVSFFFCGGFFFSLLLVPPVRPF